MVNLDLIIFLLFVAAALITHFAKRQRVPSQKRDFPESERDEFSSVDWQEQLASADSALAYRNRTIENDWGSSSSYEYEPTPEVQKPKAVTGRPLLQKTAAPPLRSSYKGIDSENLLPKTASAAKVAKRTSPFANHFRQKRSIQLAVIDRVVLGPCRANAPYGEHQ